MEGAIPDNPSGIYSLPEGYLAITGERIQPSQHNPPLEDIAQALTARLPRSGVAPMTGPLRITSGDVSAPGVAFHASPSTGLYRTTAGVGIAVDGVKVAEFKPGTFEFPGGWNSQAASTSNAAITINMAAPHLWFSYPGVKRGRWVVDGSGIMIWQDQSGQAHFYITQTGAVWTQQFGDLNTRIETRAGDYAAAAQNAAQTWAFTNLVADARLAGGVEVAAAFNIWVGGSSGEVVTALHWSGVELGAIDFIRTKTLQVAKNGTFFTIPTV